MARGFESKDVEYQQEEAERAKNRKRVQTSAERADSERRQSLELSLTRAQAELATARSSAHRQMLEHAIAALRERLERV
jgi:hypothetical protein